MVITLSGCLFVCVILQTVSADSETPRDVYDLDPLGSTQPTEMINAKYGIQENYAKVNRPEKASSASTPCAKNDIENPTLESKVDPGDYLAAFPDPLECGKSNKSTDRVVGGDAAKLGEFPWMALLGYNTRIGIQWMCGGSLISVRHVLTAAHCIYNREHKLKVVRLGELDYDREDEGAHPIDFQIRTMIPHEQYDPNTSSNDIGLLILKGDVTFTTVLHPICIRNETYDGGFAFIAGWGRISFRGTPSSHLQAVHLPVNKNEDCVDAFKAYKGRVIDQRVICAGYKQGNVDSCNGDSGGPLMTSFMVFNVICMYLTSSKGRYFAVSGVISYGLNCGYYGIYTRVTYYLPWIEEKVLGRGAG